MSKDNLGDRMKGYENIERSYLIKRMPTLIRIDGKAFHSFTKGFQRPFDMILMKSMWDTAKYLCKNVMGCKIAYTQSDEIMLLLTDYDTLTTEAWFNKNIQKIVSVSASMATMAFNKAFIENVKESVVSTEINSTNPVLALALVGKYFSRIGTAMFDSRVYVIPKEEVCNAFVWRQQDATRNSIQMLGQANFSHNQLQNKTCKQIQEMLFQEKEINFNNLPTYQKRGACIIKKSTARKSELYPNCMDEKTEWVVDEDTPIFTQDRNYIERYIF